MNISQIPASFPLYWAQNAGGSYVASIPANSQVGVVNGAASLNDGFPPDTFLPAGSGGVPPFGKDFNGILRQLSQWAQWQEAGAPVQFDATFAAAISGYPVGAKVRGTAVDWENLIDGNVTNPENGGTNWIATGGGVATIASGSVVDLSATRASLVNVTGTSAITSFGTLPPGVKKTVIFTGALTLTYNATSLILPGVANIPTAANDVALLVSLGGGNWQCTGYQKASGQSVVAVNVTNIANSQLAQMPATTIKGNNTGSPETPIDLTGGEVTSMLTAFTGDSGAGGLKGLVPAPAAGQGAAGYVLSAAGAFVPGPIGVNQAWQNVTGSRATNVSYQNTTGKPIQVVIEVNSGSTSVNIEVSTDNATWLQISSGEYEWSGFASAIIPNGHYYRNIYSGFSSWVELR